MIRFQNCSVAVGPTYLLRDIDVHVDSGAFVSIVGPNGAGKSTLLKAMLGLRPLKSGLISLDGKPLSQFNAKTLATVVGYVPQALHTVFGYSAYELVMMGRYATLSWLGSMSRKDHIATKTALELVGASEFADRPLHTLSGGERQKVWLAAAMVQQPKILLLDEPLTYLDPKHQLEMMALLAQIHETQGTTILTVSHHLTHAFAHATHVLALHNAKLAFFGTRDAFLSENYLDQVFDLPFTIVTHPQSGHPVPLPSSAAC